MVPPSLCLCQVVRLVAQLLQNESLCRADLLAAGREVIMSATETFPDVSVSVAAVSVRQVPAASAPARPSAASSSDRDSAALAALSQLADPAAGAGARGWRQ